MAQPPPTLSRLERVRNLFIVGALALGFSLTLAIFAEGNYARPKCATYAAAHQLTYAGLEYPSAPIGVPGRRPARCLLLDTNRRLVTVPFGDVAPHRMSAVLVDLATTPLLTTPLLLGAFVFGLYQVYGAMGIRARPAPKSL